MQRFFTSLLGDQVKLKMITHSKKSIKLIYDYPANSSEAACIGVICTVIGWVAITIAKCCI